MASEPELMETTAEHREDMANYLLDNYGACELGSAQCYHGPGPQCLKRGWRGRACENWKPLGARTLEEFLSLLCSEFELGNSQKRDISFGDRMVEAPSQAQGAPPVLETATVRREARDT
jgi:hypothetical protein